MKFKTLFVVFLSVTFFSCSSDDDNSGEEEISIVGTWELTEMNYDGTTTIEFEGIPVPVSIEGVGEDIDAQIVFEEDPNTVSSSGTLTSVVTITVLTESTTEEFPIDLSEFVTSGSWTISEDESTLIVVDSEGTEQTFDINALTETTLDLTTEQEIMFDGMTVDVTMNVILTR